MSQSLSLPQLLAYPERTWSPPGLVDRAATAVAAALCAKATQRRAAGLRPVLAAVDRLAPALRTMSDSCLRAAAREAGQALRAQPDATNRIAGVLAPVSEAAARVLGQRPFPTQILAAHGCVRGLMVEMATGEGKTLAASLAAATIALAGTPVHLLTVNRYLAERDAAFAAPLYQFFGLTCGLVTEAVPLAERRAAYRCPITVAVNKDIAFDYMRDRLALGGQVGSNPRRKAAALRRPKSDEGAALLRGLYHAIIDEADSVLIDEARTPLILAGLSGHDERQPLLFDQALELACALRPGEDFALLPGDRRAVLLPPGQVALAARFDAGEQPADPPWDVPAEREELIEQALTALHLMLRDEHYVVRDGRAQIIDEFTGRVMPDRMWNDGLQELIERKEGLALSPRHQMRARMTYQRFARRYRRLSGLSGTLHEVAGELWRVYAVRVARVPPHRPDCKMIRPAKGHADDAAKWRAIATRAAQYRAAGAAVLIGTRTLASSARASAALSAIGLDHAVLNAEQDAAEAAIIAQAGQVGTITVATNMAGRGTDIRIDPAVQVAGGLRVIVSEPHEAGRIDRQLIGRCGRQGQPGEAELHVSLDDALLVRHAGRLEHLVARLLRRPTGGASIGWAARRAQRRVERLHARMRRDLLKADAWTEDAIAFAGSPE
jgi:preprotein translocase subunit SecA